MECLRIQTFKGLNILQLCDILYMIGMQVMICAAVSPNSPQKYDPLPCRTYKFAMKDKNGDIKCRRCSVCPKGFQVQAECSAYNDTVCEQCLFGWYNDISGSKCKPCSECKPGEYIRRECSSTRNTSCRHCPRGTISFGANATMCVPCKSCRRNEKMLSRCNGSEDTTCGKCHKGYFRESSTGSCLLCSHCPPVLEHSVVPECREKFGLHHPDICWPTGSQLRFPNNFDKMSQSSDNVTRGDVKMKKEIPKEPIYFRLIMAVFGTLLCCLILLLSAFICARLLLTRYSNMHRQVNRDAHISLIQMSRVYADKNESVNESKSSMSYGHTDIESTYFSSDHRVGSDENIVETTKLKSFDSPVHYEDKGCILEMPSRLDMTPGRGSVPDIATTFLNSSNPVAGTSRGGKQLCENWEHQRFTGDESYGTI